jgi:sugar lactone lactonase YvrE
LSKYLMMKKTGLFFFTLFMLSASAFAQSRKIITLAGNGTAGFSGDGSSAPAAQLHGPINIALDTSGNLYVQDFFNNRIRKVNNADVITTVAGNGTPGSTGDGSIATSGEVIPAGIAVDNRGNQFISDASFHNIRKVDYLGIMTTYAGNSVWGYGGDNGPALSAKMREPSGLATDVKGNLYIADAGNHRIRKVDTFGTITTVAGVGVPGYFGDGNAATLAALDSPIAVTVDKNGNLYIVDYFNNVIRKVDTFHKISTFAGSITHDYTGDNGPAIAATLNNPRGIAVDTALNVYIADGDNNVVRKVDHAGIITTVAGNGTMGFSGDLGPALGANLHNPCGLAVDNFGNLYIADANNQRIRKTFSTVGVAPVSVSHIGISPNPFTNRITVIGLQKLDRAAIFDLSGKQISSWNISAGGTQTFNIQNLTPGAYLFHTWDSNGTQTSTTQLIKE